jgi:soluble lytic murein transglycosylase
MPLPMTSRGKKSAFWLGLMLLGLVSATFLLGPLPQADSKGTSRAPERVYPEEKVPLPDPELRALALIEAGRNDEARRVIEGALTDAKEPSLGRLRFLLAKATPDIAQARRPLEELADSTHALREWALLRLTQRLRDKDPEAAIGFAERLMKSDKKRFSSRAEQLHALALFEAGPNHWNEAQPLLAELLPEASEKSAGIEYALPLATILAAKPDPASQKESLALYRRVMTRAPTRDEANKARIGAAAVLANMSSPQRIALGSLTADESFTEAEALSAAREHARAATAFGAIVKRFKGDPEIVCDARLGQGKALSSANKRDAALVQFEEVSRSCPKAEHQTAAHFHAGRALLRSGRPKEAIAHYDVIARDHASDKLADDALLAAAVAFVDLGDAPMARNRLRQLMQLTPAGDMRPDGRFMLAWLERGQKDYAAALSELDQHIAEGTGESTEEGVGRAAYWRARTLQDLQRRDEAEDAFAAIIEARPFSYYALQSLSRIDEIDHGRATSIVDTLRDDQENKQPERLRIASLPQLKRPEADTAKELLRVAEPGPAVEELEAMDCFTPTATDELFLLCAALLQDYGAEGNATTIARRRVQRVMSSAPKGPQLALWRVVFPRAYNPQIEEAAEPNRLPPAFVRAIAREESSFNPRAVSPANAYGLIQLIRSTAKQHAQPLGLASDPESLKNPKINLAIGTAFMRVLFEKYKGNFAIVPAAYNAGPGAADKWIRERGHMPLDEWIETIPYNETRKYTRRVLQSYGVYTWLDKGDIIWLKQSVRQEPAPAAAPPAEARADVPRTQPMPD